MYRRRQYNCIICSAVLSAFKSKACTYAWGTLASLMCIAELEVCHEVCCACFLSTPHRHVSVQAVQMQRSAICVWKHKQVVVQLWDLASLTCIAELAASHQVCFVFACMISIRYRHAWAQAV
jgi:hypothetical protein